MKVLDTSLYSSLTRLEWMSCADGARGSGKDGYYKITECLRWEGTSDGHLVQPLRQGHLNQSAYDHVSKEVSHPLQAQSPSQTKCFLMFRWTIPSFSWCPSALILSLGTNEKHPAPSSSAASLQVFVHIDEILPELFLLQAAHSCSAFHHMRNVLDPWVA